MAKLQVRNLIILNVIMCGSNVTRTRKVREQIHEAVMALGFVAIGRHGIGHHDGRSSVSGSCG
jgi:hypothetical protein